MLTNSRAEAPIKPAKEYVHVYLSCMPVNKSCMHVNKSCMHVIKSCMHVIKSCMHVNKSLLRTHVRAPIKPAKENVLNIACICFLCNIACISPRISLSHGDECPEDYVLNLACICSILCNIVLFYVTLHAFHYAYHNIIKSWWRARILKHQSSLQKSVCMFVYMYTHTCHTLADQQPRTCLLVMHALDYAYNQIIVTNTLQPSLFGKRVCAHSCVCIHIRVIHLQINNQGKYSISEHY